MFVFNNVGFSSSSLPPTIVHFVTLLRFYKQVTSLPLLLIQSLSKTGTFDDLLQPGETMQMLVKRGTVYILINALVGNMTRFALGPCQYFPLTVFVSLGHRFSPHIDVFAHFVR